MRPSLIRKTMVPVLQASRAFSSSRPLLAGRNQVHTPVRRPDDFHTYLMLSSTSRQPLITLWTTSYCPTCRVVAPLIQNAIESGVGEEEGGVHYCEVEYDAPDNMGGGLGMTYMITSVPTLLSFDAGEAQVETRVGDARVLKDRGAVEEWIRREARRHGGRGGGGGGGGALFGGLFGSWR